MVARDCGGIGIAVAAKVVDDAASAAVGEARADVAVVVAMAVAMDTKDSMASRRDGCCGSFASLLCFKLSSSWLRSSSIILLLLELV